MKKLINSNYYTFYPYNYSLTNYTDKRVNNKEWPKIKIKSINNDEADYEDFYKRINTIKFEF